MTSSQFLSACHRLGKKIPILLSCLLIFAMAVSLAWQGNSWRARLQPTQQVTSTDTPTSRTISSPEQLARLFGPRQSGNPKVASPTNLRFTLQGSFVHGNSKSSSAIIQVEGKPAQRFTVGSEVSNGASLQAVYRDRVELSRNSRIEILAFPPDNSFDGIAVNTESQHIEDDTADFPDEQSGDLAVKLRALRNKIDQSETAEIPPQSTTGND